MGKGKGFGEVVTKYVNVTVIEKNNKIVLKLFYYISHFSVK